MTFTVDVHHTARRGSVVAAEAGRSSRLGRRRRYGRTFGLHDDTDWQDRVSKEAGEPLCP